MGIHVEQDTNEKKEGKKEGKRTHDAGLLLGPAASAGEIERGVGRLTGGSGGGGGGARSGKVSVPL